MTRGGAKFVTHSARTARVPSHLALDALDMDPTDELATTPISDPLDDIRLHLDDLMTGGDRPPPVDVRAYLLDPPPTAEQVARLERRRLLVRHGSIAACALVAVLLLAPWPNGEDDRTIARAADPGPLATAPAAQPELPQRVDVPVRRAAPPSTRVPRAAPPATSGPRPRSPAPARPAQVPAAAPDPTPRPAPAQPAPVPTHDAGVLVPVI